MKKLFNIICGISLMFVFFACTENSEVKITERSFLTEESVKSFIENNENILDEIQTAQNTDSSVMLDANVRYARTVDDLFTVLRKNPQPAKIQKMFRKNGLDEQTGHLQIATMKYGIIACIIEETLAEIDGEKRTPIQIESDEKAKQWLNEIKNHISASDYDLVKKYKTELYEIFNSL